MMKVEILGGSVEEDEILYCGHSYDQKFSSLQTISRIYIIPAVCIFGIFANVTNIYVFSHKKVQHWKKNKWSNISNNKDYCYSVLITMIIDKM